MDLRDHFQLLTASLPGRDHVRCQRNSQDAFAIHQGPDLLVAVVADGCSSGRFSEVGARLAVHWLADQLPRALSRPDTPPMPELLEALSGELLAWLAGVGAPLCSSPARWPLTVRDFFLFTLLGVVVRPERTMLFGLGDGLYSIDGRPRVLEAGPDNAPPYLGYRLLEESAAPPAGMSLRLYGEHPTGTLRSVLIATDGAGELLQRAHEPLRDGTLPGGLEPFEQDPRYLRNPSLLQKRLVVLGELNQRLRDDTTIALLRRRED